MHQSDHLLADLFQAYYAARTNKRATVNALKFELDYESNLFELYREIKNQQYEISPSVCFIANKPIKREIFAADFRDRIVHHLIYNYISPFFERLFINDTYSCRQGRGTSYGIRRADHFIRSGSLNYHQDCYILKLDISGYFMSIDRAILYQKVQRVLYRFQKVVDFDFYLVQYLLQKVIFHDAIKNCRLKGRREDWQGLPKSKSLFYAKAQRGLPIGNLTSQLFGNVYLNDFDHFVKYRLGFKYYGRYVDDLLFVHQNKDYLKSIIPKIKEYLCWELALEIHEKKVYLQHFTKGVCFLGVIIRPYCIYIGKRTKIGLYQVLHYRRKNLSKQKFLTTINSYLGMMLHYNTFKLRRKILSQNLVGNLVDIGVSDDFSKVYAK